MQISLGTMIMDIIRHNMKQAWSCMLANLKIICRFYAHPMNQNSVDMFGPRYVGDDFLRVETSPVKSTFVPYEISKVNFRCAEKQFLVCTSE